MRPLQEKLQTVLPYKQDEDDGHEWTHESQSRFVPDQEKRHKNNYCPDDETGGKYNEMPPNMNLKNEKPLVRTIAGSTDFSNDATLEAFGNGYTRREMNGSDDQYTGEHADHFYGEAVDEKGQSGFIERNNYLDRL